MLRLGSHRAMFKIEHRGDVASCGRFRTENDDAKAKIKRGVLDLGIQIANALDAAQKYECAGLPWSSLVTIYQTLCFPLPPFSSHSILGVMLCGLLPGWNGDLLQAEPKKQPVIGRTPITVRVISIARS
jgi:hypothetical protein